MAVTIHEHDVRASNLIFASVAISVIQALLYHPYHRFNEPEGFRWLLFGLAGSLTVRTVLAFGIRAGYGWVRMLFIFYTVPAIGLYLLNIATFGEPLGIVALLLFSIALQAWAIGVIVKDHLSQHD